MKKLWLAPAALAAAALLSVPTFAASGEELLKSADVYLTFEGEIEDANGNYSIYSDGETPLVDGRFGSAANVKNAVNYLTVEEFTFDAESFTVTAWLNAHAHSGDPVIFGTKSWDSGKNIGWLLAMENAAFKYNANSASGSRTDSVYAYAASTMESDLDTWYHVALSVDREAEEYSFYINGVLAGKTKFADNNHTGEIYDDLDNGYTFNIGEDGTGFYNMQFTLDLDYDEVAVFKGKALTAEEVVSIYTYAPEGYEAAVVTEKVEEKLNPTADGNEVLAGADFRLTFDENNNDVTGKYTVTTTGTPTAVDGISGKAINIQDGSYLTVEDFAVGTDSFTIATWYNLHSFNGDPVFFASKDWSSGKNPGYLVALKSIVGGYNTQFNVNVNPDTTTRFDPAANMSVALGAKQYDNWIHVAYVVDRAAQTIDIYVNGRHNLNDSFADKNYTAEDVFDAGAFMIGEDHGMNTSGESLTINVDFDEFTAFKRALTADEVAAIYCAISPDYAAEAPAAPAETAAPETEAPAETAAPETEAPAETAAPETEAPAETAAPETEAPAETAAPETEAPAEAPQTFDAGVIAAAAAVVALAGAVVAKKRK